MFNVLIITILIFLICFFIMSLGYIISGKTIQGSCGNAKDNPCTCSFVEKINCSKSN